MIEVRDYNYKLVGDKIYLGLELSVTGETYFKDSKVVLEFIKDGEVVKKDDSTLIPMLVGEGIVRIGKDFLNEIEFDEIKASVIQGEVEYEETFNENIEWSFNSFDEATRVISYKVKNKNSETLPNALLNLVFYNKGEIIGGASIKKENLLNDRDYYFEYQIPEEIDFTETYPYLVLPSTNKLLYKGFFLKYFGLKKVIKEASQKIEHLKIKEFVDETSIYDKKIDDAELYLLKTKHEKEKSIFRVIKNNILQLLKNIPKALLDALVAFCMIFMFPVINILTVIYIGFLGLILFALVATDIFGGAPYNYTYYDVFTYALPLFIVFGIFYVVCYLIKCFKDTKYDSLKNYLSHEEKLEKIKEAEVKVKEAEKAKQDYIDNIETLKNNIDLDNSSIQFKNLAIDEENAKNAKIKETASYMYKKLLVDYPEYQVIKNYDALDIDIVRHAIDIGGYSFNTIEKYRINQKNAIREYEAELQEKARQYEETKRLEQYQQMIIQKLEQNKEEMKQLKYAQQESAEAARRAASVATSQMYAMESLNNKLGKIKDQQSQTGVYVENMYNRYH